MARANITRRSDPVQRRGVWTTWYRSAARSSSIRERTSSSSGLSSGVRKRDRWEGAGWLTMCRIITCTLQDGKLITRRGEGQRRGSTSAAGETARHGGAGCRRSTLGSVGANPVAWREQSHGCSHSRSSRYLGQRGARLRRGPRRGRGAGSRLARGPGASRWDDRRPLAPLAKTHGTRMVGVAPPARHAPPTKVPGVRRRRSGSGAAARGSREGPSSQTRPPPRWRQRSCISPLAKPPRKGETRPRAHSRAAQVWRHPPRRMGYPAPLGRRTLRRVARAAQHGGVRNVERRAASGQRDDVIDRQVDSGVGGALVAGAAVAVLTTPGTEDAAAETLPGPCAVEGVVPAAVGLAGVLGPIVV